MTQRSWKKLVNELSDAGYESPYLDRLRNKLDLEQAQWDLEREVLREMASSLGRAEEKLNVALLELELAEGRVEAVLDQPGATAAWVQEANARIDEFNGRREAARRLLWELTIHREALGFRRNEILFQFYRIPPKRERL